MWDYNTTNEEPVFLKVVVSGETMTVKREPVIFDRSGKLKRESLGFGLEKNATSFLVNACWYPELNVNQKT